MSKNLVILLTAVSTALLAALSGCGPSGGTFEPGEVAYHPRHAAGFTIHRAGEHSRAIRITDPWQGARDVEQWIFIAADGEEPPEGFAGTVLRGPARRIVCMSSSYVAFLSELGAADRIAGVSGAEFICDSLVRERWLAGDIADVGYDGNLDYERFAQLAPDLVLMYGVYDDGGPSVGKLREMGVPCVFVGDYLEHSPQGRAEWIVALGEICGLFDGAVARFDSISDAYDELRSRAAMFTHRPEVMLNAPYRDTWYVPGDLNYMVRLVRDAGGEWVCRGVEEADTRPINIEEAYRAMQRAELWLNTNHYTTLGGLLADNPRFALTPPVQGGKVYNNNARTSPAGGSDFWESGAVHPELVLWDLMRLLHPEEFAVGSAPLYYYKKLE